VAVSALTAGMFVETSTWWLRALSPQQQVGLYISRSNIMAYAMRAFLVFYNALVSIYIEFGATPRSVALVLGASFLLAGAVQIVLAGRSAATMGALWLMTRVLLLAPPEPLPQRSRRVHDVRLFVLTTFVTVVFTLGMTVPLLVAVLVPAFRLSISYLGQIINIVGMFVVLFYIDQQMFRAMDAGKLLDDVTDYTYGRMVAFLLVGACFVAAGLLGLVGQAGPPAPADHPIAAGPAVSRAHSAS